MSVLPADYPVDKLLKVCRDLGVSKLNADKNSLSVEFFPAPGIRTAELVPASPAVLEPVDVKAPRNATVAELEAAAPVHPLDAILNQPQFDLTPDPGTDEAEMPANS